MELFFRQLTQFLSAHTASTRRRISDTTCILKVSARELTVRAVRLHVKLFAVARTACLNGKVLSWVVNVRLRFGSSLGRGPRAVATGCDWKQLDACTYLVYFVSCVEKEKVDRW